MKKFLISFFTFCYFLSPVNSFAFSSKALVETFKLQDDLYVETVITEDVTNYATNTKSGTKTNNYKDGSGNILFSISV